MARPPHKGGPYDGFLAGPDEGSPAGHYEESRGEAYVRILLTRGVGEITDDPAACAVPSLAIIAKPIPPTPATHYENGVTVVMVEDVIRNYPESMSPLDAGLLAGITRAFTMEVGLAAGIRCEEAVL